MYRNHAEKLFYSFQRSKALRFALNDSVVVTTGPHKGKVGAVIAPTDFEPEPVYLVEFAEPPDVRIPQSHLALDEADHE